MVRKRGGTERKRAGTCPPQFGPKTPFPRKKALSLGSQKSFLDAQKPLVGAQKSFLGAQKPLVGAQKSFLGAQKPLVGTQKSFLGAQKPLVGAQKSFVGAQKSFVGAQKSFVGAQKSFLDAQKLLVFPKYQGRSPGTNRPLPAEKTVPRPFLRSGSTIADLRAAPPSWRAFLSSCPQFHRSSLGKPDF
jgi:hypothetical protein